jgi:hypothetical protein
MQSLIEPSTGSKKTSLVAPAAVIWPAFWRRAA